MEKKNYELKAFDSKGKEIKLVVSNVWYGVTFDEIKWLTMGITIGLLQKYNDPRVEYNEI